MLQILLHQGVSQLDYRSGHREPIPEDLTAAFQLLSSLEPAPESLLCII